MVKTTEQNMVKTTEQNMVKTTEQNDELLSALKRVHDFFHGRGLILRHILSQW